MSTRPDVRAAWLARLVTLPVGRVLPLLYPRLLPLHRVLADPAGSGGEGSGPQGSGPLPPALGGLTAERLEADGLYLLENGFEALLHAAPGAPPALMQALFGARHCRYPSSRAAPGLLTGATRTLAGGCCMCVPLLALLPPRMFLLACSGTPPMASAAAGVPQLGPGAERVAAALPRLPTRASAALHAALGEVRHQRAAWLRLRVALRGDANEAAFYAGLVEDRSAAGQSYVEYLCAVHRKIQAQLDS